MNKNLLLLFLTLFVIQNDIQAQSIIDLESWPVRDENLSISRIESINLIEDSMLVLLTSSPDGIRMLSKKGIVTSEIGKLGRGPFEWLRPISSKFVNDRLYIWDANNLKFLQYDNKMRPIKEMFAKSANSGFEIMNDDTIVILNPMPNKDEFIHIMKANYQGNSFELVKSFGSLSNEGRLLFFHGNTAPISRLQNDIIFADPAKSEIGIFNSLSGSLRYVKFHDQEFVIDPWEKPFRGTQDEFMKLEKYIFSNSRITSIQSLDNCILVEVEHFKESISTLRYHLFNLAYEYLGQVTLDDGGASNYIRGASGNKLFYMGNNYWSGEQTSSIKVKELSF